MENTTRFNNTGHNSRGEEFLAKKSEALFFPLYLSDIFLYNRGKCVGNN